jgi:ABC-2 type transport system permease protein
VTHIDGTVPADADPDEPGAAERRELRTAAGPLDRANAIWRKRTVLALLVRRDLKVRYAQSVLGYLWSVLDPLLMSLVYWFVFTQIFVRSVGETPYILFLLAGLLPFMWFQQVVEGSTNAIRGERLVRSTALQREIWVLRLVLAKACEYIFALPVLALFAIAYRAPITWDILLTIPAMVIQAILLTGLGLMIAPVVVLVRDVDRVVRILLRFLFFATPVIYGLPDVVNNEHIPTLLQTFYALNPMTGVISLYRSGFFPDQLQWTVVLTGAAVSLVIFVVGWWVFARLERAVLKEI